MSVVSDLQASIAALTSAVGNTTAQLQAEIEALATANQNNDTAAIEASIANINTLTNQLNSAVAAAQQPAQSQPQGGAPSA